MSYGKNDMDVLDWLKGSAKRQIISPYVLKDTVLDDKDKQTIDALLEQYGKEVELDEIEERYM